MFREFARKLPLAGCPVILLANLGPAFAQEALELDTLVVTAGLQPLTVGEVASSVTVITREEIELKQYRFLADLLRDVPGFSVSQAGGAGSQTQVRARGAEANHLLVLMAGVLGIGYPNALMFQHPLISRFPHPMTTTGRAIV